MTTIPVSSLRRSPAPSTALKAPLRWEVADVACLYELPLMDLLYRAQQLHRENFDANEVQLLMLLSIETGGCREDRGYCLQAASADSGVDATKLMSLTEVMEAAQAAKDQGATRLDTPPLDPFEFVRTIAVARITMPRTMVRLSAGREQMDEALRALCFAAGANSIFYGDKLLTTSNPRADRARQLFGRLGMKVQSAGLAVHAEG